MSAPDPRLTPARPDLAARHLQGQVSAAHYVDGETREVVDAVAPVRRAPSPDAPLETEALLGERVTVYEVSEEGWAWGQLKTDRYVGYLPANALAAPKTAPTHRVVALRTFAFPGPSIKLPPVLAPTLGARLTVMRMHERLAVTPFGYVPAAHLARVDQFERDFVAVAERFLGVPYLWGGRSSLGVDCSGLVQLALAACGIAAPRDTDMQEGALGVAAGPGALGDLRRGDLVFWKGHVAIVRDEATLLHANAFAMAVALEPIGDAIARIRASDGEPTGIRRILDQS
jgi:cell wall-associated NlpC family hydrolase